MIFGTDRRAKRKLSSILMRRQVDRYTSTLAGLVVPAVVAALAASILYGDAKPQIEETATLYERVEQMRAAAAKTPLFDLRVSESTGGVRVISIHEPVGDLSLASNAVVADGS